MSILFKHKVNWKYAFGEVVLIFIGITLAIAFNNWNEWRKERIDEKEVLNELKESIEQNTDLLQRGIVSCKRFDMSSDIVLEILENKQVYHDSLATHFELGRLQSGDNALRISTAGYEALKNAGFDILRSKELQKEVLKLFENNLPFIEIVKARYRPQYALYESHILPKFRVRSDHDALIPIDLESLQSTNIIIPSSVV